MRYKIKTLTDIMAAVNHENLDRFLVDLKGFLEMTLGVDDLNSELEDCVIQQPSEMVWVDDEQHDINITIHE
jgi:hypothetical protein